MKTQLVLAKDFFEPVNVAAWLTEVCSKGENTDNLICAVCRESFLDSQRVVAHKAHKSLQETHLMHHVHQDCLKEWTRKNDATCPMCERPERRETHWETFGFIYQLAIGNLVSGFITLGVYCALFAEQR